MAKKRAGYGDLYCVMCGAVMLKGQPTAYVLPAQPMQQSPVPQTNKTKFCPNCGAKTTGGVFCAECAAKL